MSIVDQALACGFTHVRTFAGWIPVEQFHGRDWACMTFDAAEAAFFGPWRAPNILEEEAWREKGGAPTIALQARDHWALAKDSADA